ncbi:MAG: manganese catalase family protein [Candidatus Scatovivens sp.]
MITYEEVKKMIDKSNKIPYPEVVNLVPNKKYANMLYDDFSGKLGELSATTQYIYEHIELSNNKDASKILKAIAIMEMKHLSLLGDIIKKLGKKPEFICSNGNYWCSNNLNYKIENFNDMLKFNIYTEQIAIKEYRKASYNTRNLSLKRLFERIIYDEMLHIEIFKKMINEDTKTS